MVGKVLTHSHGDLFYGLYKGSFFIEIWRKKYLLRDVFQVDSKYIRGICISKLITIIIELTFREKSTQ